MQIQWKDKIIRLEGESKSYFLFLEGQLVDKWLLNLPRCALIFKKALYQG